MLGEGAKGGKLPLFARCPADIAMLKQGFESLRDLRIGKRRTNAPMVELFVNGNSQGLISITPMVLGDGGSYAEWKSVTWESGTLEASALSRDGAPVAKASVETNGKAVAVVLSLDCPSVITGTGSQLLLDGKHDPTHESYRVST